MDSPITDSYKGWTISVTTQEKFCAKFSFDITSPSGRTQHVSMGGEDIRRALERARERTLGDRPRFQLYQLLLYFFFVFKNFEFIIWIRLYFANFGIAKFLIEMVASIRFIWSYKCPNSSTAVFLLN